MNEKQFLFVTCISDLQQYNLCESYINKLNLPEGYSIDMMPLFNEQSIFSGYNKALDHTAKYKIYLHQDTLIINVLLLEKMLQLFQSDPNLGMIGLVGCKDIPVTGAWWEGKDIIGSFLAKIGEEISRQNMRPVEGLIEKASIIDGFFIATQVDLPWREDLFSGFHYYDVSQCAEFRKAGYSIGIPRQDYPWCLHYRGYGIGNHPQFIHNQQIYMEKYNNFIEQA